MKKFLNKIFGSLYPDEGDFDRFVAIFNIKFLATAFVMGLSAHFAFAKIGKPPEPAKSQQIKKTEKIEKIKKKEKTRVTVSNLKNGEKTEITSRVTIAVNKVGILPVLTKKPVVRYHVVSYRDTLTKISRKYYGRWDKWKIIYRANQPALKNRILKVGLKLRIP